MKKKSYVHPQLEILPIGAIVSLCVSGEVQEGFGGGTSGDNPWTGGRGPRRTPVF